MNYSVQDNTKEALSEESKVVFGTPTFVPTEVSPSVCGKQISHALWSSNR